MPRKAKPPHLVWIKPKHDKASGALISNGYWAIKDREILRSTGCGADARELAEEKLFEYQVAKRANTPLDARMEASGKGVREVQIVDLITFYLGRHTEKIEAKAPNRKRDYLNTMERLINFWSGKTVAEINEVTIAEYQEKARSGKPLSDNHTRRELEDLRSIINYGVKKNKLELNGYVIDWELPPAPPPRIEFYSVEEVAKLVRTAYRARNMNIGKKGHKTSVHVARFILTAVYTGSRADIVYKAAFKELPGRPYIDLETGIFFRKWKGRRVPNNKKADPVRIPNKLLTMMRRWAKESDNLVEFNGQIGQARKAFFSLKKKVFDPERAKVVNANTLRHTCASWLMARGVSKEDVAVYISSSAEMVDKHYGHFAPDFHQNVIEAWEQKPKKKKAA